MGPESGKTGADGGEGELTLFFEHRTPDPLPYGWEPNGIYQRVDEDILGVQEHEVGLQPTDISRCFNCGDPDHKVTECPSRLNRDLVALSRQYYLFFQGNLGLGNWKRIHAVEAWRQQRLDWLAEFEPGCIKGQLLKDALCNDYYCREGDEEWLKNISVWGYPPGWVSPTDPRTKVRDRIWDENDGAIDPDFETDVPFKIHGDKDLVEELSFKDVFRLYEHGSTDENGVQSSRTRSSSPSGDFDSNDYPRKLAYSPPPPQAVRWAHYPPSYFSSQHLVLYIPPPPKESWSSTVFHNTDAYLHQFSKCNSYQPPPPLDEPPPLPPTTSSTPPPPPFPGLSSSELFPELITLPFVQVEQVNSSESDMDFSDTD